MNRLQRFLLDEHVLRAAKQVIAEATKALGARQKEPPSPGESVTTLTKMELATQAPGMVSTSTQFLCSNCHSLNLRILAGKFGYYFKCHECGCNIWIDTRIDGSERKGQFRKSAVTSTWSNRTRRLSACSIQTQATRRYSNHLSWLAVHCGHQDCARSPATANRTAARLAHLSR